MITLLHTESSMGWGGQEMRTLRELLFLPRETIRPLLACRPGSQIGRRAMAREVHVVEVPMRGNFDPLALGKLLALYRRERVDLVHTHSSADSWMASMAAKLCPRRPLVLRTRHLICPFKNRLIYSFMADRVITTGEETRQYMIREKGIDPRKVATIYSGVDLNKFNPEGEHGDLRAELGIPPEAPVLGTAAVLRYAKGHEYLLEAMSGILASFPQTKLIIAGEGPREEILRGIIAGRKLGASVFLLGFQENIPRVLNTLDIFLFPSTEESLGQAPTEAMAMGKPVVASRVGGLPELVQDGETGYLVSPADPKAIAEKVLLLLRDPQLRREMGARGRKFVEARFDSRLMIARLTRLYLGLVKERKR